MTGERDKLDEAARTLALTTESVGREMAWSEYEDARDAYGDARELRGHVEACNLRNSPFLHDGGDWAKCGEPVQKVKTWYCDRAPIKGRS